MVQTLKHLLVLDLDETLIYSTTNKLANKEAFQYEHYFVYTRPYLDWFLKEISNHFRIGIWSAANELYVSSIVEQILPKNIKLEIMLGRTSCLRKLNSETHTYSYNKNITYLVKLNLKLEQIIIVDDNPDNAIINRGNIIVIKPFIGDLDDQELKFLYDYLLTIRYTKDVSKVGAHYIERKENYLDSLIGIDNKKREQLKQELVNAYEEIAIQNEEKGKRAAELIIANLELDFQTEEKKKRAAELVVANIELAFQIKEKAKRAAELIIANKELTYQNEEKEKRNIELTQIKNKLEQVNSQYEGRELKIIEFKKEINELLIKAGGEIKYII